MIYQPYVSPIKHGDRWIAVPDGITLSIDEESIPTMILKAIKDIVDDWRDKLITNEDMANKIKTAMQQQDDYLTFKKKENK